jgi:hypothetical protein
VRVGKSAGPTTFVLENGFQNLLLLQYIEEACDLNKAAQNSAAE